MTSNAAATAVHERKLEQAVTTVFSRTKDLKVALEGLIQKIDTDVTYQPNGPNWPSLLDSFSLIAGQIATLTKYLQNEKTPELRNTSCYPLFLNPERDDTIFRLTEGRVPCVNHEVVPDYFRTKPDPAVEALEKKMEEAASSTSDSQQQANKLNSICDKLLDKVQTSRQNELVNEKRITNQKYFERDESENLVGIYSYGRMLASLTQQQPRPPPMPTMGGQPAMPRQGMAQMAAGPPPQAQMLPQGGIKAESSMDVRRQIPNTHPYKRP
jgi:mediator of RNA polymerase II transcription subunit 8